MSSVKDFLTPKSQVTKENIDKLDFIKLENRPAVVARADNHSTLGD